MKKIFIILFLLVSTLSSGLAQENYAVKDSLYNVWETDPDDTSRIYSLFWLIDIAIEEQKFDSAYRLALIARDFSEERQFVYPLAYGYEYLGQLSHLKSNYDSALHYDLLSLKMYQQLHDTAGMAIAFNSVGEDYFDRELYSQAYDYYYKSLIYSQKVKDSLSLAIATYNLGRVLKEQGYFERSLVYIDSALQISKSIGDEEGIAYAHYDIGEIYLELNKYEEAHEKLSSALEISQTKELYVLIPQVYNMLGNLNHALENYEESIENFHNALTYSKKINNKQGIGESYYGLGIVHASTGNYNRAEEYYKDCLLLANDIKSSDLKSKCYLELSKLFETKGHIKNALDYFKLYKNVQDTLFNSKKSEQLAQLQIEHATQQRDLEINLLNQKQAQQVAQIQQEEFIRNVLVVIVACFVILLITLYRNSSRRRKMNNLLITQQQELEHQRTELIELNKVKDKFFSIISHDLRSPINNLAGMSALLKDGNLNKDETITISQSIQKQLKHASKLLDNLMDWVLLQSNEIKLKKENINLRQLVEDNLEYFDEINDKNIDLINKVDNTEVIADKNMLDLIIRNLLSNAIKFTDRNGQIILSNTIEDGKVVVTVSDTGIGVPEKIKETLFDFKGSFSRKGTANEKGTGLGLKLCKEFVERNGGNIWVESEEGKGSSFKFTLYKAA